MPTEYFIVKLQSVEDLNLLKEHLKELEYTVIKDEENKTLTLNSCMEFQFVKQFCEIFGIQILFWSSNCILNQHQDEHSLELSIF